jgi:hypothetical protein
MARSSFPLASFLPRVNKWTPRVAMLEEGKIKRFDCYPEGSVVFAQLGVLNNLDAALRR